MNKSEKGVLSQLRAGDPREFTRLIREYGDRLLRAAFMRCGDEALARDLVQETFATALASASTFRGDSRIYTWLYGIMRNHGRHHFRRHRKQRHALETVMEPRSDNPGPEGIWRERRRDDRLLDAVNSLPHRQREVVFLRFVEEMTLAEIATVLKIPNGTVQSRLHHAMATLRGRVPPPWFPDEVVEKNNEL